MEKQESVTLEKIQQIAIAEFLDKGFRGASLRQIVRNAGVTTGAFYGYFSCKEALFASIVEPHAKALMNRFVDAQLSFSALPSSEKPQHVGVESGEYIDWMVDYVYEHKDPVKILFSCAEGTSYDNFIHNMVEIEEEATLNYLDTLRQMGKDIPTLDKSLCHIIASTMFDSIFEIVIHDIPYDEAKRNIKLLRDFYSAGWQRLMGQI
ncbi:MAG TPA: TetR/AcrR family transcriptional regulator [Candidatus Ornithospirochaeta stercorigallinarum]|nr:TetR/AcrR family transcriptional regulator [Candidatus Ornithospirochaeta stercorigallinarum]